MIPVPMVLPPSRSVKLRGNLALSILEKDRQSNLPRTDLTRYVMVQCANHLDVVAGHDHLLLGIGGALRPCQPCANVRSTDKELRRVVGHERSVTATLVLRKNLKYAVSDILVADSLERTYVNLGLELLHRLDRARRDDDLTALDLLALDTAKQGAHVITSLTAAEFLVEGLCCHSFRHVIVGATCGIDAPIPVRTDLIFVPKPRISTSSPLWQTPRST